MRTHQEYKGAVSVAVTIRDVAALAGVSPSTVSRTYRNNPSISEETKERVRRAARQLGYQTGAAQGECIGLNGNGMLQRVDPVKLPRKTVLSSIPST